MRRIALIVVVLVGASLAACGAGKKPDFNREPAVDEAQAPKPPPPPKRKAPAPRAPPPPQPELFDPPPLVNGEAPTL